MLTKQIIGHKLGFSSAKNTHKQKRKPIYFVVIWNFNQWLEQSSSEASKKPTQLRINPINVS